MESHGGSSRLYQDTTATGSMGRSLFHRSSAQDSAAADCGSSRSDSTDATDSNAEIRAPRQYSHSNERENFEHLTSHMGREQDIREEQSEFNDHTLYRQPTFTEPRTGYTREATRIHGTNEQQVLFEERRVTPNDSSNRFRASGATSRGYEMYSGPPGYTVSPDRSEHTNGKVMASITLRTNVANIMAGLPGHLTSLGNTVSNSYAQGWDDSAGTNTINQYGAVPHPVGLVNGYSPPRIRPRPGQNRQGMEYPSHQPNGFPPFDISNLHNGSSSNNNIPEYHNYADESFDGQGMAQQASSSRLAYAGEPFPSSQGLPSGPSYFHDDSQDSIEEIQENNHIYQNGQSNSSLPGNRRDEHRVRRS